MFVTLIGIKLPSLPVSILYLHVSILCLIFVFNFAIITDAMLWILKMFDLTMSPFSVATLVCLLF